MAALCSGSGGRCGSAFLHLVAHSRIFSTESIRTVRLRRGATDPRLYKLKGAEYRAPANTPIARVNGASFYRPDPVTVMPLFFGKLMHLISFSSNSSITTQPSSNFKLNRAIRIYVPSHEDTNLVDWFSAARDRFISVNSSLDSVYFTDNLTNADLVIFFEDWHNGRSWDYPVTLRKIRCWDHT